MMEKFLDAMEDGVEFDFIANHYNSFSKYELSRIVLAYMCEISEAGRERARDELQTNEVFGDD